MTDDVDNTQKPLRNIKEDVVKGFFDLKIY